MSQPENVINFHVARLREHVFRHSAQLLPGEFSMFFETLPFDLSLRPLCSWVPGLGIDQDAGAVTAHPCDRQREQSGYPR